MNRNPASQRLFDRIVPPCALEWPKVTNGSVELMPWPHVVGSRNSHLTVRNRPPMLGWPKSGRIYGCDRSCLKIITDDDGALR